MKRIMTFVIMAMIVLSLSGKVSARLELDNILYDPAVIASGDEVDIIIQFHDEILPFDEDKVGEKNFTYHVELKPDDSLTEQYVTIQDAYGDDMQGVIFSGQYYNKRFRVKVSQDAPAGNYEFRLEGTWYENGVPEEGVKFLRFTMPVKKEGIIMDIATLQTVPAEVRPGDDYVTVESIIENAGEKDAKSVEIRLDTPEGLEASYTNNNRVWVGVVRAGDKKEATFFIDVDENVAPGVYELGYNFTYMDMDNNKHSKQGAIPFRIQSRPYLEVVESHGEGLAGQTGKLYVTVKNVGTESAESVDVRLLKQNAQPFNLDVRSDYIGELEPGEEGVAVFDINVNRDAQLKTHDFKVLIRSKGDSDEGDDTIYTYNRRAQFAVTGVAPNKMKDYGLYGAAGVAALILMNLIYGRIRDKKTGKTK